MKVNVFIIGANATGKTTLAKNLIKRFGGITESGKPISLVADSRVAFVGLYEDDRKICGVDTLEGSKALAGGVQAAHSKGRDIVVAEGMLMHTFGLNLTNAMFLAEKHLVVFLWCPVAEIINRLKIRTVNARWGQLSTHYKPIARTACRWQSIGVPVMTFNSAETSADDIADSVYAKIEELWSSDR